MGEYTQKLTNLLDASEMFCSLRYESMSGCPYGAFTPQGIAWLSTASSLCAIVSLIMGM